MNSKTNQIKDIISTLIKSKKSRNKWINNLQRKLQTINNCTCGKSMHQSLLSPVNYNLSCMKSSYHQSFKNPSLDKPFKKINKSDIKYKPTRVQTETQYQRSYVQNAQLMEKIKSITKNNNLSSGGPFFLQTTYKNSFSRPENHSRTTTMKRRDVLQPHGTKMKTESTYERQYVWNKYEGKRQQPFIQRNNLKVHQFAFEGRTAYKTNFIQDVPYEPSQGRKQRKYYSSSGIKLRSSYQREYGEKMVNRCDAH